MVDVADASPRLGVLVFAACSNDEGPQPTHDASVVDAAPQAVPSCNPRGCRKEGLTCSRDEECCQPINFETTPHRCIEGICAPFRPTSNARYVPLPTCLPDGGIAPCSERQEACYTDGDCCQQGETLNSDLAVFCLADACDKYL